MAMDNVQSDEKYDKKKFLKAVSALSGLEQIAKKVQENPREEKLLRGLGQDFHNDPGFYLNMYDKDERGNSRQWTGDMALKSDLQQARGVYGESLRGYVGKNLADVLGDFKDKQLESLVKMLPTVPEQALKLPHPQFREFAEAFQYTLRDKLGKSLNELALIQGYLQRGDESEFDHYIFERLQKFEGSKDPYEQFLTQSYLAGRAIPGYTEQTMKAYARQAKLDAESVLYKTKTTGKGEDKKTEKIFRADVVREFISKAYEKAKDEIKGSYSDRIAMLAA